METNNPSKGSGSVTAIIVLVVIALVAWVAYTQGLFNRGDDAANNADGSGMEVNVDAGVDY